MTPPDDENDRRPAWGLQVDAFDDRLRDLNPPGPKNPPRDVADDLDGLDDDDDDDSDGPPRTRGRDKLAAHPNGAFKNTRMCQTEVGLRLAKHLTASHLVAADVIVTLAGYELTRGREAPEFPVVRTLTRWGFIRRPGDYAQDDWRGIYSRKDQPRSILLDFDRLDGHVMTRLATGQRLVIFVSAGSLAATRSPHENNQLNRTIGRAMTWKQATPTDLLAVGVPRSDRFRKLAAGAREAEGVRRARVIILHVDRGGGFSGLPDTIS